MKQLFGSNYWDSVAAKINNGILEQNVAAYYRNEHIKLIKEWGGSLAGKKILKTDLFEEAFANGDFLPWFSTQNAEVFGIDISCGIVKGARAHVKVPGNLFVSDLRKCAFKDNAFDLIISNSTIDNLPPEDAPAVLKELRRILKDEGVLILTLDNKNNPLYFLGYLLEKILKTNKYYQSKCYSVDEARNLAEKNKFLVKDSASIVHIPTPFNKLALLLKKINMKFFDSLIKSCVTAFSRPRNKKFELLTGWFIAFKLVKNG
jgi:ubiquinone/menaquinone biosynthesis C-methylase UbiE